MDTQAASRENRKRRRRSLRYKLNLVIVSAILLSSLGVLALAYDAHCRQIDRICFDQAECAALNVSKLLNTIADGNAIMEHYWSEISSDAFRSLRERAVSENAPELIAEWMENRPSFRGSAAPERSLMDDYDYCCQQLLSIEECFPSPTSTSSGTRAIRPTTSRTRSWRACSKLYRPLWARRSRRTI